MRVATTRAKDAPWSRAHAMQCYAPCVMCAHKAEKVKVRGRARIGGEEIECGQEGG
jgi:hypothetical protein